MSTRFLPTARLVAAGCLALASLLAHADDFDVLRDRWDLRLTAEPRGKASPATLPRGSVASPETLRVWRAMETDANRRQLWPDLSDWSRSGNLYDHYRRLRTLALAYRQPDSPLHGDAALARSIVDGLDWLDAHKYNPGIRYHDNWWHWQIGIPLVLVDIATLMYTELGSARLDRHLAAIDHFVPDPTTKLEMDGRPRAGQETGANRLDKALAVALRGVLGKSPEKIAQGRDAISQALLYVTQDDGFYRDGSFVQHHYVPYVGSYGISVIADMAQLLYLLRDSRWSITDPNVNNVYAWVEDSYRPFIFNGVMIDSVNGRRISRRTEGDRSAARAVMGSLALLAEGAPKDKADTIRAVLRGWLLRDPGDSSSKATRAGRSYEELLLAAIAKDDSIRPADEPRGARLFPSQDRVVLRGNGFAWSLSLFSDRISAFESGNQENLRAWWTGVGMTELYQRGTSPHAEAYWATVDMKRLPGTTTDRSGEGTPKAWAMYPNTSSWVGGAAAPDGQVAAVGMAFSTAQVTGSRLRGRKSWFLFGDHILALGSDISTPEQVKVETIVDNRMLDAARPRAVVVDGKLLSDGPRWSRTQPDAHWAHLSGGGIDDGIGYVFPDKALVLAWQETREGRWSDINRPGRKPTDDVVSQTYAGLAIDHGNAPDRASYAYVVLPGRTLAQTQAFAEQSTIAVLANTSEVSAACDAELGAIGVNVWAPMSEPMQLGGRDWLRASTGVAVVARWRADVLELSLSQPSQRDDTPIELELNESVQEVLQADPRITVMRTATTLRLAVKVSELAGASVHARFRQRASAARAPFCSAIASAAPSR